jgi:hypothetical protein
MRALALSCTLLCAGFAGCSRAQPKALTGVPTSTAAPAQVKLTDPNITADEVAAIIVRESPLIPMDYLTVFESRIMKEHLWDPAADSTQAAVSSGRVLAQYWRAIRAMPRDGTAARNIMEAPQFFAGDIIDIWIVFSSRAEILRREGFGAAPAQMIESATDVMKKSGVKPPGNKRSEEFCALYRELRKAEHMTHRQAVAELVRRKKFGPGLP